MSDQSVDAHDIDNRNNCNSEDESDHDDAYNGDYLIDDEEDEDIPFGTIHYTVKIMCSSNLISDFQAMLESLEESSDFTPFPSKLFALLYMLVHSTHRVVSCHYYACVM